MSQSSSLNRVLTIIDYLNKGKILTIDNLALEFEVSSRTIRRDLDLIKNSFEDFIIKDGETFKAINLDLFRNILKGNDLASLFSIINMFQSSGRSLELDEHLKKIMKNNRNIYQLNNSPFEDLKNRDILSSIEKAISWKQQIKIKYLTPSGVIKEFTIKPYKIILLNENFYLASETNTQFLYSPFRIGLIKEVEILSKTFYINPELERFITNIQTPFSKFKKKSFVVELLVNQDISKYFLMKKYLSSQKILEKYDDGSLKISYTVTDIKEVEEIIIKWLPRITILSPNFVKTSIQETLENKLTALKKDF